MRLSLLMAVMHIMGRLGIWRPYLQFIGGFLDMVDRASEEAWNYVWWQDSIDDLEVEVVV